MPTSGKDHASSRRPVFGLSSPVWLSEECEVHGAGVFLRAQIRRAHVHEVQECYRTMAVECIRRGCTRVVVVASESDDVHAHGALHDALCSLAVAGLPAGFRMALVTHSRNIRRIYDAVIAEAAKYGIEARQFADEPTAVAWLTAYGPP
jgi:hypothetical protein